jgi:hypothetical protein
MATSVERAEQAVVGHRVEHRDVAVLEALARLRQQVRGVGHRLHAAGDDDVELAGADELVGQRDRVDARQADLVDGQGGDVHGMPPLTAAWRAVICPAPACSTWPMIT